VAWSVAKLASRPKFSLSDTLSFEQSSTEQADLSLISPLWDPRIDPLFRRATRLGEESAWWGHVPFAHWLVAVAKPHLLVELGTATGVSYTAFCEAVVRERLDTRCFAIDTWRGDEHAGFYNDEVYREFSLFHEDRYGAFSNLLRTTFDEARDKFENGSIDLLHIDGLHTYDSVKHDFENWQPKLSSHAVVLFHDINERQADFGVWRLWAELLQRYPGFEFVHNHGLGVLAVGLDVPPAVIALCSLPRASMVATVRDRFAFAGERWVIDMQKHLLQKDLSRRHARIYELEVQEQSLRAEIDVLRRELGEARCQFAEAQRRADIEMERRSAVEAQRQKESEAARQMAREREVEESERNTLAENLHRTRVAFRQLQYQVSRIESERNALSGSISWRATRPFRAIAGRVPARVRSLVRRVKPARWTVTLRTFHNQRDPGKPSDHHEPLSDIQLLQKSDLFDANWYCRQYADVHAAKSDPAEHYIQYGAFQGRNPGPNFDGNWYLDHYLDVDLAGINPLLHYLKFGKQEGRTICPVDRTSEGKSSS
jgi:hypothetical protein